MLYSFALALHIIVACASLLAVAVSAYALFSEKFAWFKKLAGAIGVFAAIETVSGFALAVLSPTATVLGVALHLSWYLGLCLIVEAALLLNTRRVWIG